MYINTQTNQYPVSEREIRDANPNTSFPVPFQPPAYFARVFPSPQPTFNEVTESVREIAPELTSKGTWEQRWEVVMVSQDVVTARTAERAAQVRSTRNAKLSASDWTQLADTPGQTRAAYVQYRQDLRNVPQQAGFPFNVTWPTEPAV